MSAGNAVHIQHPPNRHLFRLALGILIAALVGVVPVVPTFGASPPAIAGQPTQPAPAPAPSPSPSPESQRAEAVIAAARAYIGVPYRIGSEGPNLFDCSGLVFRAFADAGELPLIGGARFRAAGYLRWFASRQLATTDQAQAERGDLVIYGNGEHIGIYLGDGRVISALVTGVAVHAIAGITIEPTAFLAVDWSGERGHFQPIDGPLVPITDEPEAPAALVPAVAWIPEVSADIAYAATIEGVERVDMRTSNSRTFDQGNGRFATELFASPIFYQPSGSTEWQPIDLRFLPSAGDNQTAVSATSPVAVTVSAVDPDGGFLSARAGESVVSVRVPGTNTGDATAAPVLDPDGYFADYRDLLAPGTGLRVFPRADGFKAFVVLDKEPAANRFTFVVDAPDVTTTPESGRTLALLDAGGAVVGRFAAPLMLDSSDIDGNGGGLFTAAASLTTEARDDGRSLVTLSVDRAYLDEAVYPVFADLTLVDFPSALSAGDHTFASSEHPNANFGSYQRPETPGYYELWHGRQPGSSNDNEAYLRFGGLAETFAGVAVESATLRMFPYWQANADAALPSTVSRVGAEWDSSSLTWNTRPASDVDLGQLVTSKGAWSDADLTAYVQDVLGGTADYGLMLHATGTGSETWKRLVAESGAGADGLGPRLVVAWSGLRPRAVTDSAVATATATSSRTATWSHPALAPAATGYQVEVSNDDFKTVTVVSPRSAVGDAAATSWTIPSDALQAGQTYAWRVRAKYGDDTAWSDWSDPASFTYGGKQEAQFHRAPTELEIL